MTDSIKLSELHRTNIEYERQRHLANWFIKSSPHMAKPVSTTTPTKSQQKLAAKNGGIGPQSQQQHQQHQQQASGNYQKKILLIVHYKKNVWNKLIRLAGTQQIRLQLSTTNFREYIWFASNSLTKWFISILILFSVLCTTAHSRPIQFASQFAIANPVNANRPQTKVAPLHIAIDQHVLGRWFRECTLGQA